MGVTGFDIARTPRPLKKLKHLRMQIAAKSSKKDTNLQPAATRNLTRREIAEQPPCPHHTLQSHHPEGQHRWATHPRLSVQDDEYPTEIFIRQNIGPLMKSLAKDLSQNTLQEESSAKSEDL
jgi:hypothetical protein